MGFSVQKLAFHFGNSAKAGAFGNKFSLIMNGDVAAARCHGQVQMLPGCGEGRPSPVSRAGLHGSRFSGRYVGPQPLSPAKEASAWAHVASPYPGQPIAASMRQDFCPGITGSGLCGVRIFSVLFKGLFSWFCIPTDVSCLGRRGLSSDSHSCLSCWSSVLLWEYLLVIPWAIPLHRWAVSAWVAGLMYLLFQGAKNIGVGLAIIPRDKPALFCPSGIAFGTKQATFSPISARSCELNYGVF